MRGIPKVIQTQDDLRNLLAMAQNGAFDEREMVQLEARAEILLSNRYHHVPILETNGNTITTYYFPECAKGQATADGLTVKSVKHIEGADDDGIVDPFWRTEITLSGAPDDEAVFAVLLEENTLEMKQFDLQEANYIQGVLRK